MTVELLGRDYAANIDYSLPEPISCYDAPLPATTVITTASPVGFNRAFLSYAVGTNVWVTFDGTTPVVPASAATSTQELNPSIRQIKDGQTIKFISDTTSYVNIRYDQGQM